MNNNKKSLVRSSIEIGALIGILAFILTFMLTFYWQIKGFTMTTIIFLPFVAGLVLMIITPLINRFITNKILNNIESEGYKRRYIAIWIILCSFITYLLLDSIVFIFDSSLPKDYLIFLNSLSSDNNAKVKTAFPFGLMNSFITIVFCMISYIITVLTLKKYKIEEL